ncbi:MAG: hypothetical protein A2X08_12495 [Bacteroidetes bacterium GWA2_32_17]|nr:MAG: hypothetical protein A2X08_12495 [Bacteroidetes bacterium GWA2_32_17]
MKRLFVIIICICLIYSAYCQNIGLRANTEFSGNRKINTAIGWGLYLNINDFSEKVELLFFLDIDKKYKELPDDRTFSPIEGIRSNYAHLFGGASGLYVFPLSQKIKFKSGPSLFYNVISASETGMWSNWLHSYKSYSLGSGLIFNFHYTALWGSPFNVDLFIVPQYLFNIKNEINPTGIKSDYSENLKILAIQLGLSFILNE